MPRVNSEISSSPAKRAVGGMRISPLGTQARDAQAQAQAKALDDLMKKRMAVVKKTGVYPNYNTN
jgi:hypothetical protein